MVQSALGRRKTRRIVIGSTSALHIAAAVKTTTQVVATTISIKMSWSMWSCEKTRELMLCGDNRDRLLAEVKRRLANRDKPDGKQISDLKRRLKELDREIDRAADRLLRAPEDLLDVLAPKLSAMKQERARLTQMLRTAESARKPADVEACAQEISDRFVATRRGIEGGSTGTAATASARTRRAH